MEVSDLGRVSTVSSSTSLALRFRRQSSPILFFSEKVLLEIENASFLDVVVEDLPAADREFH